MGHAIAVRTDYTAGEVRRFAQRAKDAAQARRLLAIAAVLEGASREEAAKIGGMDRQTLRDWVIRFNEQGADGLINIPSPGMPPKLNAIHKTFLARIVEEGPIAAIHGVVRWRACDLIMRLHEEFGPWPRPRAFPARSLRRPSGEDGCRELLCGRHLVTPIFRADCANQTYSARLREPSRGNLGDAWSLADHRSSSPSN